MQQGVAAVSRSHVCVCVLGGRWKGSRPLLHSLTWLGPARSVISTNTNHVAGPMPAHLLHTGATGSSTVHLPAIRFGPEYPAESDGAPPTPAPSPDRSQTWQRLRLCYVCQYECLTWFNQQQNFEKINVVLTRTTSKLPVCVCVVEVQGWLGRKGGVLFRVCVCVR